MLHCPNNQQTNHRILLKTFVHRDQLFFVQDIEFQNNRIRSGTDVVIIFYRTDLLILGPKYKDPDVYSFLKEIMTFIYNGQSFVTDWKYLKLFRPVLKVN